MKRRALITAVCVAVGNLAPGVGFAADTAPVVIVYRAPSECPGAESFRQQLQRRLPSRVSVELLNPGAKAPASAMVVQVDVDTIGGTYQAQLALRNPSGQSSPRRLTGPQCAELLEALALTAALSVDQAAQEVSTAEPAASSEELGPSAPSTAPAPAATPSQPRVDAAPSTTQAPAPAPGRDDAAPAQELTRPAEETYYDGERPDAGPGFITWTSQATAGLTFTSPLNTSISPGLALGLQFNAESATGWSPAIGFSLQGSVSPLQVTDENASFGILSGQAYLCPGALRAEAWTTRLCGIFQLGSMHGQGENLDQATAVNARLSSAGLVLTTDYFFSSQLFIGGQLGALMALDHHRFEVGIERRVVAETRSISPWLALEVGTTL